MRLTLTIFGAPKPIYPADQASAWAEMMTRYPNAIMRIDPPRLAGTARTATQDITFLVEDTPVARATAETMSVAEFIKVNQIGTIWDV